ncbi:WD_REPEATS_REGION domain-containing protein [Haematococcus lacustris]|uniref:WD_REPEATS_REGION domain-containing protein n=1 Tax=Haematococcus lacustris TaxID=44745 RepID=A0A699YG12_HAELA|nr:WD_REPEATS_REGION domain-containing protein [Haematococcus lacustris]
MSIRYGAHLVAVQPALHLVAYAGHSSVVVACSRTQRVLRTMCAGTSRVTALAFAPWPLFSGTQLVAGHEDGSLRCWDSTSGACLRSHRKKAYEVSALAMLHRLPGQVVVGDVKGGLLLWHFTNGSKPTALDLRLPSKIWELSSPLATSTLALPDQQLRGSCRPPRLAATVYVTAPSGAVSWLGSRAAVSQL